VQDRAHFMGESLEDAGDSIRRLIITHVDTRSTGQNSAYRYDQYMKKAGLSLSFSYGALLSQLIYIAATLMPLIFDEDRCKKEAYRVSARYY
jgi:hypothetical protein